MGRFFGFRLVAELPAPLLTLPIIEWDMVTFSVAGSKQLRGLAAQTCVRSCRAWFWVVTLHCALTEMA